MAETAITNEQAAGVALGLTKEISRRSAHEKALMKAVGEHKGREGLRAVSEFPGSGSRLETSERMLLTGFDPDGKREARGGDTGPEKQRKEAVDARTKLYIDFIQKGFGNLSSAEQGVFRNQMLAAINGNPTLRSVFGEVNGGAQRATIDRLVSDDEIRAMLADVLGKTYDQDGVKRVAEIETRLLAAAASVKTKDAELQGFTTERTDLQGKKATLDQKKRDFDTVAQADLGGSTKLDKLHSLAGSPEVARLKRAQESVQVLVNRRATARGSVPQVDIDSANAELAAAQDADEVRLFTKLSGELQSFTQQLEVTNARLITLDAAVPAKQAEKIAAQHEYDTALSERETAAKEFESAIMNAAQHAAEDVLIARANEIKTQSSSALESVTAEVDKKAKEKLREHTERRWEEIHRRYPFGREGVRRNKELAQEDYQSLMKDGPAGLARRVIGEAKDLSDDEKELLRNDGEFLNGYGSDLAEKTLAVYMATGGKFTPQEAEVLAQKDWADAAFQKWVDKDANTKQFMNKLKEKGLTNGKLDNLVQRFGGKFVIGLLLLLFGIVGWGIGGPAIMSTAASAGGEVMRIFRESHGSLGGVLASAGSRAGEALSHVDAGAAVSHARDAAGNLNAQDITAHAGALKDQAGGLAGQAIQAGLEQKDQIGLDAVRERLEDAAQNSDLQDLGGNLREAARDPVITNAGRTAVGIGAFAAVRGMKQRGHS